MSRACCQRTLNKRPQCDLACGLDVDSVYNVSMAGSPFDMWHRFAAKLGRHKR